MSLLAVGIDVGQAGGKGLDLVALDEERRIVATLRRTTADEVARLLLNELRADVVCIDSPSQWVAGGTRRPAERALTGIGINLYSTPSEDQARPFHNWMRDGFAVYAAISSTYPRYQGGAVAGTAAEYYPHAAAVTLAGHIGQFADKVRFRRDLLRQHGVDELALTGGDQVDAALGALTGLIALESGHTWVGEGDDALLLPVRELPQRLLRDGMDRLRTSSSPAGRPRSPASDRSPCLCGCGGVPAGVRSRFMPGHDNRRDPATGRRFNEHSSSTGGLTRGDYELLSNLLQAFDRLSDQVTDVVDVRSPLQATAAAMPRSLYGPLMAETVVQLKEIEQSGGSPADQRRSALVETDAVRQLVAGAEPPPTT